MVKLDLLNEEKENDVQLEGYELFALNRQNKRGGGVAVYVRNIFECKIIQELTTIVDDVMECITIEIILKRSQKVIVSCVYRTPGSCIDLFNNKISELLDKGKSNNL